MPIYVHKHDMEQGLAELAENGRRQLKRQLRVRWHDSEVAHVEVVKTAACNPNPSQDLVVFSDQALDLHSLGAGDAADSLRLVVWRGADEEVIVSVAQCPYGDSATSHDVHFIPNTNEIFSRHRGLLETDKLRDKRVLICGVGSVGSTCAVELAKCGVGQIDLVDHDRLELHNVARHACGVSDLGRRKVLAVRDLILDKNPSCEVNAHDLDVLERMDVTEQLIRGADVVLVATDSNASRLLINAVTVTEGRVAIYGRAMTRACGLDVIRVRPGAGPCYQCLIDTVLRGKREEVSTPRQAETLAYADRPVVAEPGLANDLMPLSQMMTKLSLQELLRGMSTELRNLDEDLTADLFIWSNRRTDQQQGFVPMGTQANRATILRWYGIDVSQVPRCALCVTTPQQQVIR
ncbi:MAG: ubiquitin-like modifier-activating enzyme 5 [Bryobacterales bacterium]|nr:ubiquitin-like modifier-activating enzyme 5 [Bryobacterales bacterium]